MPNYSPGRWWEAYFVRYALGTLLGAAAVLVATAALSRELFCWYLPRLEGGDAALPAWVALLLAGLAYCYVASAPITVIHAARLLPSVRRDRLSTRVWLIFGIGAAALACMFIALSLGEFTLDTKKGWWEPLWLFFFSLPAVYCLWDQYRCIVAIRFSTWSDGQVRADGRTPSAVVQLLSVCGIRAVSQARHANGGSGSDNEFVAGYRELAVARVIASGADIRDSYTHLREHGNAIWIVLLELSLLSLVLLIARLVHESAALVAVGLALFAWIVPNRLLWGIANAIEADVAERPSDYLPPEGRAGGSSGATTG